MRLNKTSTLQREYLVAASAMLDEKGNKTEAKIACYQETVTDAAK